MKKLRLLVAVLGLCAEGMSASAQATLTTYYVVPPTNGCDGVWAFGPYSALWSACSGPYVWTFDPVDCVDGSQWGQPIPLNVVGDTIIMDLCSQPCDFLFYSDTGLCLWCFCGPLIPTNIPGEAAQASFSIGPNPVPRSSPTLVLRSTDQHPRTIHILDIGGRSLMQASVCGERSELDLGHIPGGSYLLLIRDGAGRVTTWPFLME